MTRTGHVPRLQEAEPPAQGGMGATSLLALGVKEGDLVRLLQRAQGGAAAGGAG